MGWSLSEYFKKFGHDIEMSERRKKRALEDELGKFYRTWGDEICRCYDGLVIEAQALARDDEEITTLARQLAEAAPAVIWQLGSTPQTALGVSVLFLIPGIPLINAMHDILDGHALMGIARAVQASVLIVCIAIGLSLTMMLLGVWLL